MRLNPAVLSVLGRDGLKQTIDDLGIDQKVERQEQTRIALGSVFKTPLHDLMTGRIRVIHFDFGKEEVGADA